MSEIDFLPADYHPRRLRRQRRRWHHAISLIFAGLAIAGAIGSWMNIQQKRAQLAQLNSTLQAAETALPPVEPLRQELAMLQNLNRLRTVLEMDISLPLLLEEIGRAQPASVQLVELRWDMLSGKNTAVNSQRDLHSRSSPTISSVQKSQDLLDSALNDLTNRPLTLVISGLADDHLTISRFLERLHRSPHFAKIRLVNSMADTYGGIERQRFTLSVDLRQIGRHSLAGNYQSENQLTAPAYQTSEEPLPTGQPVTAPVSRPLPKPVTEDAHEVAREPQPHQTAVTPLHKKGARQ